VFHSGNVPWQRVINAKGGISPRSALLPHRNKALLPVVSITDWDKGGRVLLLSKRML
jgi:alkylated DNA nucleotide flippase Atl1